MRVLQLIDSLDAGGAERIAVTFANHLVDAIEQSHLCATRAEGVLKQELRNEVGYLFVAKRKTLDLRALFRLRRYVKEHGITIVHAHTTSFFFGTMLKWLVPNLNLVWHTHLGERATSGKSPGRALRKSARRFDRIIAVNEELQAWCQSNLATKTVDYLPNFVSTAPFDALKHLPRQKKIVCLANLKVPKNHENLLKAFGRISAQFPDWRLELAGKDFQDSYASNLRELVAKEELQNKVVFLGQQQEVPKLLCEASVGVLSSDSEGLPMALLEYGAAGLAVVVTNVGRCGAVVDGAGKLVPPGDEGALALALTHYLEQAEKRQEDGEKFREHIRAQYSVEAVLPRLVTIYNALSH
ncbi:MAG: glycosyltransferase [Bacteroidota bacterium]